MPIIREYECGDCGHRFESMLAPADVNCPKCSGEEPERVFLTPPGLKSPTTARSDTIQKELASDFGLTDMSNKDGKPVKQAPAGANAPQFANGNPQTMQMLQKLGAHGDGFSSVLPVLQRSGRPNEWSRALEKRK